MTNIPTPKESKEMEMVGLRLTLEVFNEIKELASQERRPLAAMARILVEDALEARKRASGNENTSKATKSHSSN